MILWDFWTVLHALSVYFLPDVHYCTTVYDSFNKDTVTTDILIGEHREATLQNYRGSGVRCDGAKNIGKRAKGATREADGEDLPVCNGEHGINRCEGRENR